MPVVLLTVLIVGFACLGAPPLMLLAPVPIILATVASVRKDIAHVRTNGWNTPDGPGGCGPEGGPDTPVRPGPPDHGSDVDWDLFESQFADYVQGTGGQRPAEPAQRRPAVPAG